MPNRLSGETSPYLLQHQHNPVDWYPWGPEALELSRREEKPIFLSIGYAACHWCHVMEHESFENAELATLLNERFVCIKVDREERPDLDQIYMNAVQLMTGRGGWPMSVFLTPELQPFYAGTYWPPRDGRGMPGFDRVIRAVHDAWVNRREQAIAQAAQVTAHLAQFDHVESPATGLQSDVLVAAGERLTQAFDSTHGGFGGAPKFPHALTIEFLLRSHRLESRPRWLTAAEVTLEKMAHGGIYDHLAGGFARYSVDEFWLVPHFEKMLYDNALLTDAYLAGYLVSGRTDFAQVARETCDYVLRYLRDPAGGFHSSEDADSEGEEGKFYVWTPAQIAAVLPTDRAERFCDVYGITRGGNFEHGQSIAHLSRSISEHARRLGIEVATLEHELAEDRAKLLAVRDQRVRPGLDDKVLVNWNGLMIAALARAANVLDEPRYYAAAKEAAEFMLTHMRTSDGRLLHTWRRGRAQLMAYLDDYSALLGATLALYECEYDERWIEHAVSLAETMITHYHDPAAGGFFFTAHDHEQLLTRSKDFQDGSVPSGNSLAATALLRLAAITGQQRYRDLAFDTLSLAAGLMERAPSAAGQSLMAAQWYFAPTKEVVVVGCENANDRKQILRAWRRQLRPTAVLVCRDGSSSSPSPYLNALFDGRGDANAPTLFICEGHACQAPVHGVENILAAIEQIV